MHISDLLARARRALVGAVRGYGWQLLLLACLAVGLILVAMHFAGG